LAGLRLAGPRCGNFVRLPMKPTSLPSINLSLIAGEIDA
jgi:hypothetical protein